MFSFRSSISILIILSATGAPLFAQGTPDEPPLETLLATTERQMASQRGAVELAVRTALEVFRSKAKSIGPKERDRQRTILVDLGPAALPKVMEALESKESQRRVLDELGRVLFEIDDRSITPRLRALRDHKDLARATVATELLGHFRDRESAGRLREIGNDEKAAARLRAAAIMALARMEDPEAPATAKHGLEAAEALVRRSAARAYEEFGKASDGPILGAHVKEKDSLTAQAALRSLGRIIERTKNKSLLSQVHPALYSKDTARVLVAIEEVVEVGSKDLSAKKLKVLVRERQDEGEEKVRKAAAIGLYKLGDSSGLNDLARGFKENIADNPRNSKNDWRQLSDLYLDFGDWSSCLRSTEKLLDFADLYPRDAMRVRAARCSARLGKYRDAAKYLEKAVGDDDWSAHAEDEAFAEMKKRASYRKNFAAR